MQDPYFAVKEEVEHSVTVLVDLHKRWQELSASSKKSDEQEWTASELLSGLRSIEWDLQDLEDTVSIVEGSRQKYNLEEAHIEERKQFIESTRRRVVAMRDEVQGESMGTPGYSTSTGPKIQMPKLGSKAKGYGKVGSNEDTLEMVPANEDEIENGGGGGGAAHEDEILGAEPDPPLRSGTDGSLAGRHRRKKWCLSLCVILLLLGIVGAAVAASQGATAVSSTDGIAGPASSPAVGSKQATATVTSSTTTTAANPTAATEGAPEAPADASVDAGEGSDAPATTAAGAEAGADAATTADAGLTRDANPDADADAAAPAPDVTPDRQQR